MPRGCYYGAMTNSMSKLRSTLYRYARLLGDLQALASGNPRRIAKRYLNKVIGRKVVGRIWR